jgi:hypothetical protein
MTAVFALVEGGLFAALLYGQVRFATALRDMMTFWTPRLSSEPPRMSRTELEALAAECHEIAPAFMEPLREHAQAMVEVRHQHVASTSFLTVGDPARIREHHERHLWVTATFAEAGPGLLTAFGILGTFVGLVAGLPDAGQLDDQAIGTLISGLQTSFRTSIWGLLGSMTLTAVNLWVDDRATSACAHVGRWIDSAVPPVHENWLLGELRTLQGQATSSLKTLNTDLSVAIERSLNQTMGPALTAMAAHAKEMSDVSRATSQVTTTAQIDGIQKIIEKVVYGLDEAIGSNLRTAGMQLQAFAETQTAMQASWQATAQALNDTAGTVTSLTERQHKASQTLLNALKVADGSGRELAAPAANLVTATAALQKAGTDLVQIAEKLAKLSTDFDAASTRTRAMSAEWEKTTTAARQVATDLTTGMTGFAKQFPGAIEKVMVSFDKELARGTRTIADSTTALQDAIDQLQEHLEKRFASNPSPTAPPRIEAR